MLNCSITVFKNCTFRDHRGLQYGSAVSILNGSKAYISTCVFAENNAQIFGGALYVSESELWVYESSFFGNSAQQAGGIGCHDCLLFVSSVYFINNTAFILHGGAIFTHRAGHVC